MVDQGAAPAAPVVPAAGADKHHDGKFKCGECGFDAASEFGLKSHMRKHEPKG